MMKVGIVNDSRMASEVLRRVLAQTDGFELMWSAASGEEALKRCAQELPDILLMDLVMPGLDGAETTKEVMRTSPCVILVVTATTVGNRDKVFEAMGNGALDAVNTPTLGPNGELSGADPLVRKLQMVSRFVRANRANAAASASGIAPIDTSTLALVAIGASTGGPQALAQVLSHLPEHFPAVVLVAQHVDEQFAPGLATWLQHHTKLPVRLAAPRERLTEGGVWLAGNNNHMIYERGGYVNYTEHPAELAYRPSADVLFESLTLPHKGLRMGVLLTGMGRDGAEGLLSLRKSGGLTVAQDAATSVVYGMPKAAAELHAAQEILPITAIGQRIRDAVHADMRRQTGAAGAHL